MKNHANLFNALFDAAYSDLVTDDISVFRDRNNIARIIRLTGTVTLGEDLFAEQVEPHMDNMVDIILPYIDDIIAGKADKDKLTALIVKELRSSLPQDANKEEMASKMEDKMEPKDLKEVVDALDKDLKMTNEATAAAEDSLCGCHDAVDCCCCASEDELLPENEAEFDEKFMKAAKKMQKFIRRHGDPSSDVVIITAYGAQWCSNIFRSINVKKMEDNDACSII